MIIGLGIALGLIACGCFVTYGLEAIAAALSQRYAQQKPEVKP